ncbi:hypothetical protein L596_025497 [Steinernema carpocapsae]|uniref:Uncharacterized protein n=1 Tax=Steinernema carpocapsae TaxID=34508 RepID=A0A4U5M8R8_STECR|nr:hypothetical protein L596_025497 [Steinernema carpocapsae]
MRKTKNESKISTLIYEYHRRTASEHTNYKLTDFRTFALSNQMISFRSRSDLIHSCIDEEAEKLQKLKT